MHKNILFPLLLVILIGSGVLVSGQSNTNHNKFKQLKEELATPNVYRTASGAPGHEYWQQKADYNIDLVLNDETQQIFGKETVTYTNNSPDALEYLWVQLDQNRRAKESDSYKIQTGKMDNKVSFRTINTWLLDFDGGFKIDYVQDKSGQSLSYTINKTMMRINLKEPLKPGKSYSFKVKWWYNINDRMKMGGRSGYEYFEEEDNYLYTIAQFFPRMAVYNEVEGWQNKQFLGRGEFTLPFGDYSVKITVPADHQIAATGTLQNESEILSSNQMERLRRARNNFDQPVLIVNQEEAEKAEKKKSKTTKTWHFKAENVRDFGFASSRKFIWDAMAVKVGDKTTMAMSMYPKEGNPLWEKYSTKAVAHTLKVYSKYTIDYPYPVAWSINAARIGMEYPMICFNYGRCEEDGTYSKRTKYGMIGVIIHEVGHNFFPMIINSDERQWTWMDEGLNTFVQYLTEQEWEKNYPSRRAIPSKITDYMKGEKSGIAPIMTNSETILQFGNNAYGKPATALNILRETIMGRELFDYSFKTYANRWAFKHPSPEDFFRTMEDASAVDLDWFWRGWFYTTDHVDISLDKVNWYKAKTKDPDYDKPIAKASEESKEKYIGAERNAESVEPTYAERDPELIDFYSTFDSYSVNALDRKEAKRSLKPLSGDQLALLKSNMNYYEMSFSNIGGLVMPIILEFEYKDGSKEIIHIPAEIWMSNNEKATKVFPRQKELVRVVLDPKLETADCDRNNNYWPTQIEPTRFEMYIDKWGRYGPQPKLNKMQRDAKAEEIENAPPKPKEKKND